MNIRGNYNKYSDNIKSYVIKSKNPYAYSSVPRSTARHWIQNSELYQKSINKTPTNLLEDEVKKLRKNLKRQSSLVILITNVRKLFPYPFAKKKIKDKELKKNIILEISKAKKYNKLYKCLEIIDLSLSSYKRWKAETKPCVITKDLCAKTNNSTITLDELQKMRYYLTSPKYQHIPISRIYLVAQRENKLFCSLNTWYKYNTIFEWRHFIPLKYKRKKKPGLKASRPNEYWHIDVSVIELIDGKKVYLQAIIDNFSRYIVNWQVTENISLKNTFDLINKSELLCSESTNIISDQGSENKTICKFKNRLTKNLSFLLARIDIRQSNSMIESFFKSLKNNYLYKQKLRTIEDANRHIRYYVNSHNNTPVKIFKAASPTEIYNNDWSDKDIKEISKNQQLALIERKNKKTLKKCKNCYL